MTKAIKDFHGVGFCTKEFNQWTQRIWNSGNNHSVVIYQHGWLPRSTEFTILQNEKVKDPIAGWFASIWNPRDTIIVEMNMGRKMGKIWNKDNPKMVLCIGLPDECTFLLMMGNQNQVITIKDIQVVRG